MNILKALVGPEDDNRSGSPDEKSFVRRLAGLSNGTWSYHIILSAGLAITMLFAGYLLYMLYQRRWKPQSQSVTDACELTDIVLDNS